MTAMIGVESKTAFGSFSRGYGVFNSVVATEVKYAPACTNLRRPLLFRRRPRDAYNAAGVVARQRNVHLIFGARDTPEIGDAIVMADAIDVVDIGHWPFSVVYCPCNAVCPEGLPEYSTLPIPIMVARKRLTHRPPTVPQTATALILLYGWKVKQIWGSLFPKQLARLRLIAEQLAAQFWRDNRAVSHIESSTFGWLGQRSGCHPFAVRPVCLAPSEKSTKMAESRG